MSCRAKSRYLKKYFILFPLYSSSFFANAQPYQWDWAINGGGSMGSGGWDFQVEQIFDIAIDKNNNYYFLAKIKGVTPQLHGQQVTIYGRHFERSREVDNLHLNLILFSMFYSPFSILYSLFSSQATAQNYQWTWETYGDSDAGDNGWFFKAEQLYDVVVGSDDNYYFLANIGRSSIGSSGSQLAGQPVRFIANHKVATI